MTQPHPLPHPPTHPTAPPPPPKAKLGAQLEQVLSKVFLVPEDEIQEGEAPVEPQPDPAKVQLVPEDEGECGFFLAGEEGGGRGRGRVSVWGRGVGGKGGS